MTSPHNEFDASELIMVKVIYSPADGSPPELAAYANIIVGVPPSYIPLPARGKLFGVNGFSRQVDGAWQWVLQGAINPVESFVDSLTGRGGWLVPAARADIILLCQQLLSQGIPSGTIVTRIPVVYSSIAAEVLAENP
jgi:hypothetical protein